MTFWPQIGSSQCTEFLPEKLSFLGHNLKYVMKIGQTLKDQLQEALARNSEAFKLLNEITNNAAFDFNLQYERRFEMAITNLVFEKKSVQKLSANVIYDLHTDNAVLAAKNVRTILALVNGTSDERTVSSQLVRIAIAQTRRRGYMGAFAINKFNG